MTTLERMGFPQMYAVAALRQTDNNVSAAIEVIQNQPELLITAMADSNEDDIEAEDSKPKKKKNGISEEAKRKRKEAEEAVDRLQEAIGDVGEDDHLDLALEEDRELLKKYQGFLGDQ